jgi:hypothetical protein
MICPVFTEQWRVCDARLSEILQRALLTVTPSSDMLVDTQAKKTPSKQQNIRNVGSLICWLVVNLDQHTTVESSQTLA